MSGFPLHGESNDKHQTFIIVVAWFFTLLGAYTSLTTLGRLILMFWTVTSGPLWTAYALTQVVDFLFSIAAFIVGLGMLNRRATALRNSVAILWLYCIWHVGGIAWGVIEFSTRTKEMASLSLATSELAQDTYQSGLAYLTYSTIFSIVTCAVCLWLAGRLSLPIIKVAYAT